MAPGHELIADSLFSLTASPRSLPSSESVTLLGFAQRSLGGSPHTFMATDRQFRFFSLAHRALDESAWDRRARFKDSYREPLDEI